MAAKKILKQIYESAEQGVKSAVRETGKQALETGRQFEAQLLYGTTSLSNQEIKQGLEQDKVDSAKNIENIQKELSMQAGGQVTQTPENNQSQKPQEQVKVPPKLTEAFGIGLNDKPETPEQKQLALEHHREQVKDVIEEAQGPSSEDRERMQKKQLAEEEEKRKKLEEKQSLENPIEAPSGRTTGMSLKRKKPKTRMQKPPKTGENKVGQGGRE